MISKIRKTITGIEYWDSKKKKTIFVPNGEKPNFEAEEVQENQEEIEEKESNLNNMTIAQLKEYAASLEINIPKELTKRKEIIEFLQ